jgi:hypothetical protein
MSLSIHPLDLGDLELDAGRSTDNQQFAARKF